jgi:hypothetical protein
MPAMSAIWRVRAAVLTLAGALAVHAGRYAFATREHEHELAAAHAYLSWVPPLVGVLAFLGVVQLLGRLRREAEGARCELPSARVLWMASSAVLLHVFVAQESLEMVFAHGRLPEVGELLGAGGWTAIPIAVLAGALVALLLRGAAAIVAWARRRASLDVRRSVAALLSPRSPGLFLSGSVLARRLAGRGPPALS